MVIQITPTQLEIYRKTARDREIQLRIEVDKRRKRAWDLAYQAANILKNEFSASRVAAFGSLLHPELFHLRSDIDLAVWDIQKYFHAVSRLMDIDPEFEFNLVPIEDASASLAEMISHEGKDL